MSAKDFVVWEKIEGDCGRPYYFNTESKASTWHAPKGETDWIKVFDNKRGRHFYHNVASSKSVWDIKDINSIQNKQTKLATITRKWIVGADKSTGRKFYYNTQTKKSVWKKPEDLDSENCGVSLSDQETVKEKNECKTSEPEHYEVESKDDCGQSKNMLLNSRSESKQRLAEFYDYVLKRGGGTSLFGRKNWKRRYIVVQAGKAGLFNSDIDFQKGLSPLKDRWIVLKNYRLEEAISDPTMIRLLPTELTDSHRIFEFKCDDEDIKKRLYQILEPLVAGKGFVRNLHDTIKFRSFRS